MQLSASRLFVGALILLTGIVGVQLTTVDAADAVPEKEFKALTEQDIKNIQLLLNDGKPAKKTADRSIKSSALMIAAYAQSRLGANAADDAKLATLRDTAIKVAMTGGKKKYMDAVASAKMLDPGMAAAGKPDTKKIDLIKATEVDMEELMYQFKKTAVGGLGIEEEIKASSKKAVATMTPEKALGIAQRIQIVGEFCDSLQPQGGFSAAKPKKDWDDYNKKMKDAATDLATAAKGNNPKGLMAAFTKVDASCVACHNKFK